MVDRRRFQVDPHGQVDGDWASLQRPVFPESGSLLEAIPPWHMWGNTQRIEFIGGAFGPSGPPLPTQLTKVAYKRPDTWHWLFHVALTDGPVPTGVQEAGVEVVFDVVVGIGRSMVQMPSVESFLWRWGNGDPIPFHDPALAIKYSSAWVGPPRISNAITPPASQPTNFIDEIVAQDIQLNARIFDRGNYDTTPQPYRLEVSAYWAPKTHIRPDWHNDFSADPAAVFTGGEVAGR